MDQRTLRDIIERFGTPCFVYDFDRIKKQIAALREAFGRWFSISYAMKTNPNPSILRRLQGWVDGIDVSSGGELRMAIEQGWLASKITFTGPAKRAAELSLGVETGIGSVVVESVEEARKLSELAATAGKSQKILIRIAPAKVPAGFGSKMAGRPSQFGIDEEDIDAAIKAILRMDRVELAGFHVYSGTQCLDAKAVAENYIACAALFTLLSQTHRLQPQKLIFGSGLGIPYHEQDRPVDLATVATIAAPALDALRTYPLTSNSELTLETGRYLVGEAGIYLTSVVSAKHSRGTDIRICDGGMNHHLGACGHLGSFKVGTAEPQLLVEQDLFGPLCTSIDVLGRAVKLPLLNVGDVIGIHCSGAYGLTASPTRFISHDAPRELLVEMVDGRPKIIDISVA